jgi:cytoskeleton protein RodZ
MSALAAPVAADEPEIGFGETLRLAREKTGKTITTLAEELRINPGYLEALEKENIYALPAAPYAVGFLRAYAQHLGLAGEPLAAKLKRHYGLNPDLRTLEQTVDAPRIASVRPGRGLVYTTLALAAVATMGWWTWQQSQQTAMPESLAATPSSLAIEAPKSVTALLPEAPEVTLKNAPAEEEPAVDAAAVERRLDAIVSPTSTPLALNEKSVEEAFDAAMKADAAPKQSKTLPITPLSPPKVSNKVEAVATSSSAALILVAEGDSWVEVRQANGRSVYTNMMKAGERYTLPDVPGLRLKLGNAGAMRLSQDNRMSAPLGNNGRVVRLQLNTETLQNLMP